MHAKANLTDMYMYHIYIYHTCMQYHTFFCIQERAKSIVKVKGKKYRIKYAQLYFISYMF